MQRRINSWLVLVATTFPLLVGIFSCSKPENQIHEEPELVLEDRKRESTARILERRFSFQNSLTRVKQIRKALESFHNLTKESKGKLSSKILARIGNTDGSVQYIGFPNWTGAIEGTLRKQDYQIQKLEYELAKYKYQVGRIVESELQQKEKNYRESEHAFRAFWSSFYIVD